MKRRPSSSRARPLSEGINALARAVRRPRLRRRRDRAVVLLPARASALASDEVLIAIADGDTVALRRLKMPARPAPAALADAARRLAEIEVVAAALARTHPDAPAAPAPLTGAEERLLSAGGLDAAPLGADEAHLVYRGAAEFAGLVADAYTVEDVARLLSVNTSRVRQRLTGTPRTLYGIKTDKGWRIPRFQFHGRRLVPGIERVLARLAPDVHPVAVYRWLTSPSPDLTIAGDRRLSPLDWLRLGNAPDVAAALAAEL